ncbi:putative acyl-CoA thioesterase [Trypanosoma grayi]|uniref:putative acyl-CoA thioesterase n=1 Tax=Trypanosoma grayi TaxID=71804 RepID=UPI0004F41D75|nr:putative acyl-CoA thioesterase [Trypanosoma grayi]KEG13823.1 putative acyl-CoA thioesterase [Trypanosoma grayi]
MTLKNILWDFEALSARALQLEDVGNGAFRSVQLWTPSVSRATYGGQLVAHCVEAAYRTVGATNMDINSLHLKFLSPGNSEIEEPILYTVKSLRDGRSFCMRLIVATQQGRTLLTAFASFHRRERSGIQHQICHPFRSTSPESTGGKYCTNKLSSIVEKLGDSSKVYVASGCECTDTAGVQYINLMDLDFIRSESPWDVWMRMDAHGWALLQSATGIPKERLHIIVACWLSDFLVAFASLLPHGFPNTHLRVITSLDHSIYFHSPELIRVDDWFLYEVSSPWAARGRGLNHGRMYGQDGALWMSTSQETLLRMTNGFVSKL